jgi:hypothetical protein
MPGSAAARRRRLQDLSRKKLANRRTKLREEVRERALSDWGAWLRVLGLATGPSPKFGTSEDTGEAWFDMNVGSPYWQMLNVLEDKSIRGVGLFAPRGSGKSYSVLLPWICLELVRNPSRTFLVGSESEKLATRLKVLWLRDAFERLERLGFGEFKTTRWTASEFSIKRPGGPGGQPSVLGWGPKTPGTGGHPDDLVFDDLYGEHTAGSPDQQADTTRRFIRVLGQRKRSTRVIIVGTIWPGRDTYYAKMIEDPKISKRYHVVRFEEYDKKGEPLWACLPEWHLQRQRDELAPIPGLYNALYKNRIVGIDELMFSVADFHVRKPVPTWDINGEPEEDNPDNCLATFLLTDCAYSTKKGASWSALGIVQVNLAGIGYIREVRMGRWDTGHFCRELLKLWKDWEHASPEYYAMEDQGPGGSYPGHIEDVAKLLGVENPPCLVIHRGKQKKNDRIALSRGYMKDNKTFFSPDIAPDIFHIDRGGEPRGLLGDSYMRFSYKAKGSFDGLDMAADLHGTDAHGVVICPPPTARPKPKPEPGVRERSLLKILGRKYRKIVT